ncbi:MAG: hypothetical protein JNK50_07700 [Bacteroidia bacterium]|nr:hypothetical protein [Bacteroidia bacterium]
MKALKSAIPSVKRIASFNWLVLSLLLNACAVRSVYIPVSQNTPLFDSSKVLQASAYIGANHIEAQAAFNPVKKLGVCANINYGSGISIYDVAVGTYAYNKSAHWRYEVYGGYGYNSNFAFQTANYNSLIKQPIKNYEIKSFYDKMYLQPAIGYFNSIKMYKLSYSFSLSARISALYYKIYSFKEIDDEATKLSGQTVYLTDKNYNNSFLYLLEPCFTNKVGIKNFYAILQFQGFIPYSEQIDVSNTVFSQGILMSVGLQYNFVFKRK